MPTLKLILPDGTNVTHELTEYTITVGRLPDSAIYLEDISVSSRHAELTLSGGDYVVQDLGSTNGSRLNGQPMTANEEHRLQDGDIVRFGSIDGYYASEIKAEQRQLPSVDQSVPVEPAASSVRPTDFENASPFIVRKKEVEPGSKEVMAFAIFAVLVFIGAMVSVFLIQGPSSI